MIRRKAWLLGVAIIVSLFFGVSCAPSLAEVASRAPVEPAPDPGLQVNVMGEAVPQLEALWRRSVAERRELVACLAAERWAPDRWTVVRIEPIPVVSDAGQVLQSSSLSECGAPEYVGTVHTHPASEITYFNEEG